MTIPGGGELLLVSLLTRLTIIAHTDLRMYVKTLKHAAAREKKKGKELPAEHALKIKRQKFNTC